MNTTRRTRTRWSDEEAAEAIRLYVDQKWSLKAITEWFGRSGGSVWMLLKRRGVQMRPARRPKSTR